MTMRPELAAAALGFLALSALIGCASAPTEVDLPPQTLTPGPGPAAQLGADPRAVPAPPSGGADAAGLPAAEKPPPVEDSPGPRSQTVVIQSAGGEHVTPQSLFEASETERARRANSGGATVTLTNENLAEHAEGAELTVASPESTTEPAVAAAPSGAKESEQYWRTRGLDLRLRWKEAAESIEELEAEAELHRRRFYEEDNPVYRDREIKPAWDRALEDLDTARRTVRERQDELDAFLEEGRRAGAFPGWLDEGADLEPPRSVEEDDQAERRRGADPREPKILDETEIRP